MKIWLILIISLLNLNADLCEDKYMDFANAVNNNDKSTKFKVDSYLNANCGINNLNYGGEYTLLIKASHELNMDIIKYLITKGADTNIINKDGENALLKAMDDSFFSGQKPSKKRVTIINFLLDIGTNVNLNEVTDNINLNPTVRAVNILYDRSNWNNIEEEVIRRIIKLTNNENVLTKSLSRLPVYPSIDDKNKELTIKKINEFQDLFLEKKLNINYRYNDSNLLSDIFRTIYYKNNEYFGKDPVLREQVIDAHVNLLDKLIAKNNVIDSDIIESLIDSAVGWGPFYAHYEFDLAVLTKVIAVLNKNNIKFNTDKKVIEILEFKYNPRKHNGDYEEEVYDRVSKVLKVLLSNVSDINIKNKFDTTPLHWAIEHNKYKLAKFIIEKGANIKLINSEGYSAFDLAENSKNKNMKKLLQNGFSGKQTSLDKSIMKKDAKKNYNSFAIIIGINKYLSETAVPFADNSAKTFALLSEKVLGIPKENIILLTNEKATSGQIKSNIELITQLVEEGNTLYFYYAGHGVPDKNGETYILPSDMKADNIHLENQLLIDNIYKKLSSSLAKEVIVFMDSCFSGKDDQGKLLYEGVAPILKTKKSKVSKEKISIFSAGSATDFANQYKEEEQRLFSYFVINGLLEGKTTAQELSNYVKVNVKRNSLKLGLSYKQVPQYEGNDNLSIFNIKDK